MIEIELGWIITAVIFWAYTAVVYNLGKRDGKRRAVQ